jgi:hypothetical protein
VFEKKKKGFKNKGQSTIICNKHLTFIAQSYGSIAVIKVTRSGFSEPSEAELQG